MPFPASISTTLAAITMGAMCPLPTHANERVQADDVLCQSALDLINRDVLGSTFLPLMEPRPDDRNLEVDDLSVVAAYEFELTANNPQRQWLVNQGGSCNSTGLRVPDGSPLSIDQRMIDEGNDFGLQTRLLLVAGEVVALVYQSDRWHFTPLTLGRWKNNRLSPACAFAMSGIKRVQTTEPADPVCSALIAQEVELASWQEVDQNHLPESPLGMLIGGAMHTELDWTGSGKKRKSWRLAYFSSASCGMTYQWIALDKSTAEHAAVDDRSKLSAALFAKTPKKDFERRPWIIDSVFTYQGRAWLAGQPQQEDTEKNSFAVYRFDRNGSHVQCQYRSIPQFEIEQRSFGKDRVSE
jgi:hypothetical protein